jgi:hypothetical protein
MASPLICFSELEYLVDLIPRGLYFNTTRAFMREKGTQTGKEPCLHIQANPKKVAAKL